jgi:hypothetical protein
MFSLWSYHSLSCTAELQALSRLQALPVLPMALLLQTRRLLLASPVAADIIINLFVLDQVCLVAATNALLSNSSAPAGCRRAGRAQAGAIVCAQTNEYVQVCTLSILKISSKSTTKGRVPGHLDTVTLLPSGSLAAASCQWHDTQAGTSICQ